jgi:hypothetical protein
VLIWPGMPGQINTAHRFLPGWPELALDPATVAHIPSPHEEPAAL